MPSGLPSMHACIVCLQAYRACMHNMQAHACNACCMHACMHNMHAWVHTPLVFGLKSSFWAPFRIKIKFRCSICRPSQDFDFLWLSKSSLGEGDDFSNDVMHAAAGGGEIPALGEKTASSGADEGNQCQVDFPVCMHT